MSPDKLITELGNKGTIPPSFLPILERFFVSYLEGVKARGYDKKSAWDILERYSAAIADHFNSPYNFPPYHRSIKTPFDYHQLGMDFFRPLIIFENSIVLGLENVEKMVEQIGRKENVILFGNHQIEPDPQVINLLLESHFPRFAEEMIFVAGHKVTTDPLAVPFSKGRNLLCIHSKKHIDYPIEEKEGKILHNQTTMRTIRQLLSEGGHCIYVAPSGGRDRINSGGVVEVAPFDPMSIELFFLTARQAQRATHFYPLALSTYFLLPPPETINHSLGEERHFRAVPTHVAFCDEIVLENETEGSQDKKERRSLQANKIWQEVTKKFLLLNSSYTK